MTTVYQGVVDLQPFNKSPGTGVVLANRRMDVNRAEIDVQRIMDQIDRSLPAHVVEAMLAQRGVTPGDGRSAVWAMSTSPSTPWLPAGSGETSPVRYLQGDVGKRYYLAFRRKFQKAPGYLVRTGNFHIIPGYMGWNSEYAHSPTAIDWIAGKDSKGVQHTHPFLQFSAEGGGYYDPLIDFMRDTIKDSFTYDVYDVLQTLDIAIELELAHDQSGWLAAYVNGEVWIPGHHLPTCYAGTTVKSQHGSMLDYAQTLGQTGLGLWDGGYEAAGVVDAETAEQFLLSMTQIGESPEECHADVPHQVGSWATVAAKAGAIASSIIRGPDLDVKDFIYPASWKLTPTPVPTPPPAAYTVTDTLPANTSTVPLHGVVTWQATPSDVARTAKVEFFIDAVLQMGRPETTAPYGCTNIAGANSDLGQFDTTKLSDGLHAFETRATTTDGVVASSKTTVVVKNAVAPPPPPVVDVPAAILDSTQALIHLRNSAGYKAAKQANPNPASFAKTEVGQAEALIVKTLKALGG